MIRFFRMVLFAMFAVCALSACKQAQDESAAAAKEAVTEMKANTIDAAQQAAALAEHTASDIAKMAEQPEAAAETAEQ